MKKLVILLVSLVLLLQSASFAPPAEAAGSGFVRIGLYYGSGNILASANLANEVGSGYAFGFFDSSGAFTATGYTSVEKITMLPDKVMTLTSSGFVEGAASSGTRVGAYHVDAGMAYGSADEAANAASGYRAQGWPAFPCYVNGEHRVRIEHFSSSQFAEDFRVQNGLGGAVVGSSATCVTVVDTNTGEILYEYDGSGSTHLGVMPQSSGARALTWFKGYKYAGGFEYRRPYQTNLSVINVVGMEDYIKGVIPYEMPPTWPLEALKAQAVCARSFAEGTRGKHASSGFDLCASTDCQVYHGANSATALSDQAVDETAGIVARYSGSLATTFYHSSNGGSTESCKNVWGTDYAYLQAVPDTFENLDAALHGTWKTSLTASQIQSILNGKGYSASTITNAWVDEYTPAGNVYRLMFQDATGKTFSFERERARIILNGTSLGTITYSQRFQLGSSIGGISQSAPTSSSTNKRVGDTYDIGVEGKVGVIVAGDTGSSGGGTEQAPAGSFLVSGRGWGHNVGMSQWGARGMAEQGYSYVDIIKHYFTGVDVTG